jgi:multidrug efflux pump subunit AcrB
MMNNPNPYIENETGLIAWFINNHVAANILMMLLVVGGVISIMSMRTETFPQIDPRMITISVPYPGATPYEIEESITSRVEDALTGIEGVKQVSSLASEGIGLVTVELLDFSDENTVYDDVDTAVNGLSDFPPADAERALVQKVKLTPNVMTLAIHGQASEGAIKFWAESIEDDISLIKGVANTTVRGVRNYQISIEIPDATLRDYQMNLGDIAAAIRAFSTDIPAGTIESKQGDILLRVQEKRYNRSDFESIIIRALPDGSVLRLGDIAAVKDGFTDQNLENRFNGERAAMIDIARSDTGDTLSIAQSIRDYLGEVSLPKGLVLTIQNDQTVALNGRISLMVRNAIIGFMLVFLILLLFLDLKLAFWTSIAVPVSFLGGLMIMNFFGLSINMISVFALIVVLGVVVDDAIIVGESIFEEQRAHPHDPHAVLRAVRSVVGPVTVGVFTTIAAFAPLLFSTGGLGQIIGVIPAVVIPILFVSLLEAYYILPSHLSKPNRWSRGVMSDIRNKFSDALARLTNTIVAPVVGFTMRFRYATIVAFVGFAFITFTMMTTGVIRFVFLPNIEADRVEIKMDMPIGTPYSITEFTMNEIESAVLDIRDDLEKDGAVVFKSVTTSIGEISNSGGGPGATAGSNQASHRGQVQIEMVPSDLRDVSSRELESTIRPRIENLPNIETLEFQSSLIRDEPDIDLYLSHPDENQLNQASEDLKNALKSIKGTKEVTDSFTPGKIEYVFELTPEGYAVGLTPEKLGRELRSAFFGIEAQRIQRGQSEVIVYVRYPKAERESLTALQNMRLRLDDGREVPLQSVAQIKQQTGYATIESFNGLRYVSVTAKADEAVTTAGDILKILRDDVMPDLQQRYVGLNYSLEGEGREQAEDLASLGRNMLIAVLLIYVLLGAQLRSYIQPLIIMSAIPFGVVGALWGHYLLGHDLTFISLFGMVALSGVVVNDSVVLIDYLNKEKGRGLNSFDAAISAVKRRFRPILLTTLTTSIGLLPILLEPSIQAKFLVPMVVSLATGIIFATVVIMILVPCLVLVTEDVKSLKNRILSLR